MLRGMMDDHEHTRAVDAWFAVRWRWFAGAIAALSGVCLILVAILDLATRL